MNVAMATPITRLTVDAPYTASDSARGSVSGDRMFTIYNHCSDTIWYHLTAGSVVNPQRGTDKCNSNNDCIKGSSCVVPPGLCFWDVPRTSAGTYELSKGSSSSVIFESVDNGIDVVWSGNIGACTSSTCDFTGATGNCSTEGCHPIGGSPQTLAEFTLQKNNVDYYDVEVINGFDMAVEMTPLISESRDIVPLFNASDPYQCGNAGGMKPMTGVGSCSWQLTPPSYEYQWVTTGGASCHGNNECSNGNVCGISNNVGVAQRLQRTCGRLLGYWSDNQICGIDPNFGAPFYCNDAAPAPNDGLTKRNMLMCDGTLKSCYQRDSSEACCGCGNWWRDGIDVPSLGTQECVHENAYWNKAVKPGLLWLKRACPTAYTYPYDDKSSTFVCQAKWKDTQLNTLNYDIHFCADRRY